MKKVIVLLIFSTIIFSCKDKTKIFNGNEIIVEIPAIDTLYGQEIKIDGVYTGGVSAWDSILLFISYKYSGYTGATFSIKTGKEIAQIVNRGQGPDEYITPAFSGQFETSDTCIGMWFYDWAKLHCILVDVITDVQIKKIDVSNLQNGQRSYHITGIYILNDSLLLAYNLAEDIEDKGQLLPPLYRIFNYINNTETVKYEIYNTFLYNREIDHQSCLYSFDKIKPDRTKLAMAMENLRQINILDIETGNVTAYRHKNTPDFDIVKQLSNWNGKTYYTQVCVDDDLIYAVIPDEKNTVTDVFDWNGNFKKELILDRKIETGSIALDPVNKHLYVLTDGKEDEEVYCYDVKYLYKK